jgi:AraC-like DNA-binding protein
VGYREDPTVVAEAVLWQRAALPSSAPTVILPDGCLDLIWDGHRLFVAGPDSTARRHQSLEAADYWALRFSGGLGPALLGVGADELRDRNVEVADLWSAREGRLLADRVAADPAGTLTGWLAERLATCQVAALGRRVFSLAEAGLPVSAMADRLGLSERQLHRRCLPLFGYGPRHLARVLRLTRALDRARSGEPLAQVAAGGGYCDQAHLAREVRALTGTTPSRLIAELKPVEGALVS